MSSRYLVPSLTDPTAAPYVVLWEAYDWTCTCPAFRPGKPCKHVRIVLSAEANLKHCQRLHAGTGVDLCDQCVVLLLTKAAQRVREGYVPKEEMQARVKKLREASKARTAARKRRRPKSRTGASHGQE